MSIENQSLADAARGRDDAHDRHDSTDSGQNTPRSPNGSRTRARMAAIQALYQWRVAGTDAERLTTEFSAARRLADADTDYFETLVRGVLADADALAAAFDAHLDRPAVQLDPVEYVILLLATFELRTRPEVPVAVVINEATELARTFGATDGHRFVNAVADAVARAERPAEIRRKSGDAGI